MGQAKEHYHAKAMDADASLKVGVVVAGFLAKTSGTITITDADGTVIVDAVPVTAGGWTRIPLWLKTTAGGTVALGGGASGSLFL